jgi:hypothetical protein
MSVKYPKVAFVKTTAFAFLALPMIAFAQNTPEKQVETVSAPPAESANTQSVPTPIPPATIDTNGDGKADAWDRDANGMPDAWDVNGDGQPDQLDNNGDGKPDAPQPLAPEPASEPDSPRE